MKEQKGITLIALIVTVIVMLILLGVTVSWVADGGLFDTTKEAAQNTNLESYYEKQMESGYLLDSNGEWVKIKEIAGIKVETGGTGEIDGIENSDAIVVSNNPTHILTMGTKKYKISTSNTWKDLTIADPDKFEIFEETIIDLDKYLTIVYVIDGELSPVDVDCNKSIYSDLSTASASKHYVCGFDTTHLYEPINFMSHKEDRVGYEIELQNI